MKRNEIIVYEHKKGVRAVKYNKKPQSTIEPPKTRNPVAKNAGAAIGGGAAGAHKDAKKASQAVRGQKHKNAEMAEAAKKPNATTRHLRDYPVSDKDVAKPVKKPEKKKSEQGVAEVSQQTLQSYRKKAAKQKSDALDVADRPDTDDATWVKNMNIASKRKDGIAAANKRLGVDEMYGRKSSYYNPMDDERDQQRQMDYDKREFKRQELQHELGHEDDPDFERKQRQQQMDRDRGPWYIKVNGKILKVKGEPKVFDWKKGANNYALAVLKNKPELQGKIMLTKRGEDDVAEAGAEVGTISKVDPMTKKATVTKADGSSMEVDSSALKPTPDGKMQMDVPDSDDMKSGTKVVSTEMTAPPTDSSSPIPGDNNHDEISKLLVHRLRRLAGL